MTNKKTVSIVIPIYKDFDILDKNEIISLTQVLVILSKYQFTFVCSVNTNINKYLDFCSTNNQHNVNVITFNQVYFNNITGYNNLLMSISFYKKFNEFKNILIYQLDAFVFKDELEYWCGLGYDYIGAPWINVKLYQWFMAKPYPVDLVLYHTLFGFGKRLSKVGNGGFSLRKVESCINNLILFKKTAIKWKANEDSFFAHYVKTFNKDFKIPPENIALAFSFDIYPELAYSINKKLPFGCHAWFKSELPYKNNLNFWEKYILNKTNAVS